LLIEANELINYYINKKWQNNIIILDASWYLPTQNRDAYKEYVNKHIPKALFFDIDKVCDINSTLPHTVPNEKQFKLNMGKLGITNKHHIIIYSTEGIGTSPRAWWLFKLFGHQKISILNGGLKAWSKINDTENNHIPKTFKSFYKATINNELLCTYLDIKTAYKSNNQQIVDARSKARFTGIEDEPRLGLKRGHIPQSINIPFSLLIDEQGYLLKKDELIKVLNINNFNFEKTTISTCGSGVTACVLAFALDFIGKNNWRIYDGSWSEWGSKKESLIEI
jgi:thiosulfate/3-mercaptopyruvate sulfurtransferase